MKPDNIFAQLKCHHKKRETHLYDKIFFSSYKELLDQVKSMDDPVLSEVKGLLIDGYTKKVRKSIQIKA